MGMLRGGGESAWLLYISATTVSTALRNAPTVARPSCCPTKRPRGDVGGDCASQSATRGHIAAARFTVSLPACRRPQQATATRPAGIALIIPRWRTRHPLRYE